ncbi:MAG: hypothetical protein GYB28_05350 [Gammaproteobacteria bacterium]|uniref:DUF4062 domain-containing protein n=1 Tax=Vreelandella venusta TaxID=44935 RepID=A0ABX2BAW8_9GAMM|nr:hypothetical protein [Halomonas venusta]AZM96576.1 hypothetical protein EI420_13205 [Halomonas venusta]MBR9924408.1 hypothetical protein [Gammaproteobacteria bacterium]MDX1712393.1 hypothetical protein [Halomonas venusta]NPT30108.1 hypothetical protein [Halomonas venusta]
MAYKATVLPVMIASPGDVADEREITRQVIHDWNDVNSQRSQVMLAAVGWDSHSSPELGVRAQELINTRVLKDCDLLVGIFWTRLGTPTGKAQSGTVEEIEEHVAAGKPAMIYFSSKPVSLESVELEQYKKVQEVRSAWQQRGLVETYDNLDQFRNKLSKQLQLCLNKNEYLEELLERSKAPPIFQEDDQSPSDRPYHLSAEATSLLKAAATDEHGIILKREYIGGQDIQAGNKSFGSTSRREFSKWEAALNQLVNQGLVIDRGYKGEYFELTHEGWEVADAL